MNASNGKLWAKINDDAIEIRSLTLADLEEALDALESFFLKESICNGCEINLPGSVQARQDLRELCRLAANDGVSLVAKEVRTGQVVAVTFNKIQYVPEANEVPFYTKFRNEKCHSPQAKCFLDFMNDVEAECDVFEKFNLDCLLELVALSTSPAFERKGIARALVRCTIDMGRRLSQGVGVEDVHPMLRAKRPQAVAALFTSTFSQKVGRSQNFTLLNSVPYSRFTFNGKTFDKRIDPQHPVCEHVAIVF